MAPTRPRVSIIPRASMAIGEPPRGVKRARAEYSIRLRKGSIASPSGGGGMEAACMVRGGGERGWLSLIFACRRGSTERVQGGEKWGRERGRALRGRWYSWVLLLP